MNHHRPELKAPAPIRLMVVEDDPDMVALYSENFRTPEFKFFPVKSPTAAVELLESSKKPFDVIIANKSMPEIAGIILLRKIKNGFPAIRVIMVNGYGNWPDYLDVHSLGVRKVIDKPFKMAELKNLVRTLTEDRDNSSTG